MDMFFDHNGKLSSIRVCCILITLSVMGIFIAHNIMSILGGRGFVSLGMNEVILLSSIIGVKVVQSFSESKKDIVKNKNNDVT